jgi:hypothetical protein
MYCYKIGYNSYEESNYKELEHEEKFTDKQITEMVGEAIIDLWDDRWEDQYAWVEKEKKEFKEKYENCEYEEDFFYELMVIEDFFEDTSNIWNWLIENKGFKKITYTVDWSIFGWDNLAKRDSWKNEKGKHSKVIRDMLTKAGKLAAE